MAEKEKRFKFNPYTILKLTVDLAMILIFVAVLCADMYSVAEVLCAFANPDANGYILFIGLLVLLAIFCLLVAVFVFIMTSLVKFGYISLTQTAEYFEDLAVERGIYGSSRRNKKQRRVNK